MEIDLTGIVVIVGNYGSGKTEVCINLAVHRKRAGIEVRIADLDLVNPYFRTREAKAPLANLGIEVVLPPEQYLQADLPILSALVSGMIRKPSWHCWMPAVMMSARRCWPHSRMSSKANLSAYCK